jgi:hypothetical protein
MLVLLPLPLLVFARSVLFSFLKLVALVIVRLAVDGLMDVVG